MPGLPRLSVVSPFYNEVESLPAFCAELRRVLDSLGVDYEVILVDDGSIDGSFAVAATLDWPQLTLVRLAINAGHQAALEAGLLHARGDFTVTMDADLQHPPAVIPDLLRAAEVHGVDVVYATRSDRTEEGLAKRSTALWYYRIMRRLTGVPIVDHAADFRLMSRFVVDILNRLPERKVYRLLIPSLGFSSVCVPFTAAVRSAGVSKYNFRRMASLAVRSSVQFSPNPLRAVAFLGLLTSVAAVAWLVIVLVSYLTGSTSVGWPSLMSVILILGGITLFSLGVIGEYVGEQFQMSKGRPHFIVRSVTRAQTPDEDMRP